ncbi:hypothetical protein GCM10027346_42350 [Hymenobacter seoulensis]
MTTSEKQKQGAELIKTLAHKAWESSSFKDQLVKNPVSTIESVTGHKLAENVKVVVEDQTNASVIFLNIPRKPNYDEMELTDEQLETIAGGEVAVAAAIGFGVVTLFAAGIAIGQAWD